MLCDAVAADRRANPRDDIMTALVQAEIDGERLDDAELNLFFITLVVAGNETTRNLINHSMLALIDHPDQAQRLRDDPSLWDTGRRGDAPLGQLDPQLPPHRHPRHRAPRRADQGGRQGRPLLRRRPTATRRCSPTRTASTSAARRTTTSPSAAAACTSASAPAWPAPRSAPPCASSSSACPTSSWPARVNRLHSDFVNGIKTMPVRFTPTAPSRKD